VTLHSPRLSRRPSLWLTTIFAGMLSSPVTAQSFRSDSKRFGNSKMDIVITETERQARTSVVDIHITAIGSSAEPPERLDPRLAGQPVIDLDYFALICDKMQ
jgi:hypothetical protein